MKAWSGFKDFRTKYGGPSIAQRRACLLLFREEPQERTAGCLNVDEDAETYNAAKTIIQWGEDLIEQLVKDGVIRMVEK